MPMICASCETPIDPKKASDPCPKCGSVDRNIRVGDLGYGFDGNQELMDRLKNHEDNFTERKPDGVKPDEIRKTIVAFSNSVPEGRTGVLYIGLKDNGDIQGVSNSDSLQKTIRSICEKDCYPSIQPRIEVLPIQGKSVIAVVVPESRTRPHFSGPAYVRIGSESIAASEKVFDELITSRLAKPYEILKWKGKVVTVITKTKIPIGRLRGSLGDSFSTPQECEVKECTPHYVRLRNVANDQYWSASLENVRLATDEKKLGRLMLIITEKI
jgi:hypothetical protein